MSDVIGISIVQDGQLIDLPEEAASWPYQSVAAALQDGWRVIKFPDHSLVLDESRNYALGCEFVLEKVRPSEKLASCARVAPQAP